MKNRIKSLVKKLSRPGFQVWPKGNNKHIDPVCGMEASADVFKVEHKGKGYYFCSNHCEQDFKKDPETYATK